MSQIVDSSSLSPTNKSKENDDDDNCDNVVSATTAAVTAVVAPASADCSDSNVPTSTDDDSPAGSTASAVTTAPPPPTTNTATNSVVPISTPSTTTVVAEDRPDAFPCIEQPLRFTLHCRNGYYLWGLRSGRVIARKYRSERDEFRLRYVDANAGIVEIYSHKFGAALTVVVDETNNGQEAKIVCVKREGEQRETKQHTEQDNTKTNTSDTATPAASNEPTGTNDNNNAGATANAAEEDDEEFEDEPAIAALASNSTINPEDRQWCFVRGAQGEGVLLKSLRTGDNLAIDEKGNVVLVTEERPRLGIVQTWDVECVTGELCFLSNPRLNQRVRCDMAGLLSLTDAWKGWEVFRITETGSHHYVKISSWMHSQWFLCCTPAGDVTCCSHSESLKENSNDNNSRCSEWAIEKSPEGMAEGVIIRSKSHGRLLCVEDGVLKTHDPNNRPTNAEDDENDDDAQIARVAAAAAQRTPAAAASDSAKMWWNNSVRSMNRSMRQVQKRLSTTSQSSGSLRADGGAMSEREEEEVVPRTETLVWQIEAAHSQTYYFLNATTDTDNPKPQPRSIGPFPRVTTNLRQTEKIQLKRTARCCKLFLVEKDRYVSCSPEGGISLVHPDEDKDDDKNTEWIMEKLSYQEGGSVFRSKHHNLYLSYAATTSSSSNNDGEETDEPDNATEQQQLPSDNNGYFKNPFGKSEPVATLVGSETVGPDEIWKLEPSMPRAISSEKIKTFAIGTGIAVGTTIAMPFALAGASAVLGVMGAEAGVLFNVIAVGLSGAEALASVGAIGATAYIVFRPEENSLTDDHNKRDDEEDGERAWSRRPFSNWRNW